MVTVRWLAIAAVLVSQPARATTYYVSSASGLDSNNGQSPATPFASVARVNAISLQPGDEVRFFCGETWRADPLAVEESGALDQPVVYTSYPAGCANRPLLSGARPIAGWALHAGAVWVADLDEVDVDSLSQLPSSDHNALFNPWDATGLCIGGTCHDLPGWRAATGLDGSSFSSWYSQAAGEPARSALFVNETATPALANLGGASWVDLDQNPVSSLLLPPFASAVLVRRLDAIFADGFETGTTNVWSATQP